MAALTIADVEALERKVERMNIAADALRWDSTRDENTPAEASAFRRDLREGYAALANAAPALLAAAKWAARNDAVYAALSEALADADTIDPDEEKNNG